MTKLHCCHRCRLVKLVRSSSSRPTTDRRKTRRPNSQCRWHTIVAVGSSMEQLHSSSVLGMMLQTSGMMLLSSTTTLALSRLLSSTTTQTQTQQQPSSTRSRCRCRCTDSIPNQMMLQTMQLNQLRRFEPMNSPTHTAIQHVMSHTTTTTMIERHIDQVHHRDPPSIPVSGPS